MMRIFLLLLIISCAKGQVNLTNSVLVKIQESSFSYKINRDTLDLTLTFYNNSNDDVLVYGINGSVWASPYGISRYCNLKDSKTGIAFALYDKEGKQKQYEVEIADKFDRKKITREMIDSTILAAKQEFLKSAIVLKKYEERTFSKKLIMRNFDMQKGLHYLQIVYFCGDRTLSILDLNKIKKSNLKLFQGCSLSEKIPVFIE